MSDRLKDLQRQRALAQEQLAWLDREIARETGGQPSPSSVPTVGLNPRPASTQPADSSDADAIISQYQDAGRSIHAETRRGCFIYLFAAFGAVALGLVALYLSHRR
jgi:hypothetical protein